MRSDNLSASLSPKWQKQESVHELEGELEEDLAAFEKDLGFGGDFVMPSPTRETSEEVREDAGGGWIFTYLKDEWFIKSYHGEVGNGLRRLKTQYKVWLENQRGEEKIQWDPFTSEQEWRLHCPRAGPGRVEAIFAGPDPDPQGRATLSLGNVTGFQTRTGHR